jgi:transposase, IS5 family
LTEERPCEFGVKVSLATTLNRSKGGQFIAHAKALPGNPYDGHTLAAVIPEIETQIGANLTRIVAGRGYRGHNAPPEHKFKVYISGQRRRVTETIKRELRRRPAVEPVIGLPIPTKPPVYNGMIAPRDSWMMPPPCNEMIPPGAPRLLA